MEKRFKVGETVIALSDHPSGLKSQPRKKGHKYIVNAVSYCVGCGRQAINIGPTIPAKHNSFISCVCGSEQPHKGLHWTHSKHFARPEELESEMRSAVEEENYEHASVLRDLINQQ